jgi:hypothetical protein
VSSDVVRGDLSPTNAPEDDNVMPKLVGATIRLAYPNPVDNVKCHNIVFICDKLPNLL